MFKYLSIMAFTSGVLILWIVFMGTFDVLHMNKSSVTEETPKQAETSIGSDFALTGVNGEVVKSVDSRGKVMLVYFGFSSCPDVCPVGLAKIGQVMEGLKDSAASVVPYFITVDPERDTPQKLKEFSSAFDPRIIFLTGNEEQISEVADNFKAFHQVTKDAGNVMVDHSSFLYLMNKEGKYVTHFTDTDDVDKIVARVREALGAGSK